MNIYGLEKKKKDLTRHCRVLRRNILRIAEKDSISYDEKKKMLRLRYNQRQAEKKKRKILERIEEIRRQRSTKPKTKII